MEKWRKMTKKELKEHLERFYNWVPTIADRIDLWKKTLPETIASRLDMSKKSLHVLEEYLVDNFTDYTTFFSPSNSQNVDGVCTYIGEVYRANLHGEVTWKSGRDEIIEADPPQLHFPYEICLEFDSRGESPARKIPYILHNRTSNCLLEYLETGLTFNFTHSIEFHEKAKTQIPIPGRGGYSYQHFLLLKNDSYGLKDLENFVSNFYAKRPNSPKVYLANEARLVVEFTKEFCFHFWYDDRPNVVAAESKEIAEEYRNGKKDKAVIAACKRRIEFWGDSDPNGEYFNEHLFLLSEIVNIPDLLVFNFKQGVFYDEM